MAVRSNAPLTKLLNWRNNESFVIISGSSPSKAVLFEGENHELSRSGKPLHRMRRLKEMNDWFDLYLKGEKSEC